MSDFAPSDYDIFYFKLTNGEDIVGRLDTELSYPQERAMAICDALRVLSHPISHHRMQVHLVPWQPYVKSEVIMVRDYNVVSMEPPKDDLLQYYKEAIGNYNDPDFLKRRMEERKSFEQALQEAAGEAMSEISELYGNTSVTIH